MTSTQTRRGIRHARKGFMAIGLLSATLGMATLAGTADASPRQRQSDCGPTIIRHSSNHGRVTSIHRGSGSHWDRSSDRSWYRGHQSNWGSRGGDSSFFSLSIGTRSGSGSYRAYSGSRSLAHRVGTQSDWYRPVYGYRDSYSSCSSPSRPVVIERPVIVDRPVVVERPTYIERRVIREVPVYRDVPRDAYREHRVAWNALIEGDLVFAREYFLRELSDRPNNVTTRAGLAIARAASGFDDQAEWAMRQAVRAGLNRAAIPAGELDHLLRALEERYTERSHDYNDRWLMVASLRYLQGDSAGAARAADRALEADRHDKDANQLYQISRYGA